MRPPGPPPLPASRYYVSSQTKDNPQQQNDVKSERQYLYLADCWMVRGSHGTITISPSIRLDTLRDSDIKIEIYVWYINVVNFSPFLSYAMFGGAEHCHNCY